MGKPDVANEFERNYFKYDRSGKSPSIAINGDDFIFLGLGLSRKHHGFRKDPHSFDQSIYANISPFTGAYNIGTRNNFYSVISPKWDLRFNANYNNPKYFLNYYGIGNSTLNLGDNVDYYRIRSTNLSVESFVQYRFTKVFKVGIGPGYEYYKIDQTPGRIASTFTFPNKEDLFGARFFTTKSYLHLDFVNDASFPTSGVKWYTQANYFDEIKGRGDKFLQLKSDISFYGTPNFDFPVTVALRFGAAKNIGDYKFYQANSLGANTALRGFRNNRFAGDSYLYNNTELRFRVTNFRNYVFTGNFGVFGFYDVGRVYSQLPEENEWHSGYGPGIWIDFYKKFMISGSYGLSKEGGVFNVNTGITF